MKRIKEEAPDITVRRYKDTTGADITEVRLTWGIVMLIIIFCLSLGSIG